MAVIPKRTTSIIIILVLVIGFLAYLRLSQHYLISSPPPTETNPLPTAIPNLIPTAIPTIPSSIATSSNQVATISALPTRPSLSLTPLPHNSQTGWNIYHNPTYNFTFSFPPTWKLQDYGQSTSPMVTVATQISGNPVGFMVSSEDWGASEYQSASVSGSFSYQNWLGNRYQQTQNGQVITIVSAIKTAPNGQVFRTTWLYPSQTGGIDTFLKPILNTFIFTSASPTP